jgi:hypothetical protein
MRRKQNIIGRTAPGIFCRRLVWGIPGAGEFLRHPIAASGAFIEYTGVNFNERSMA